MPTHLFASAAALRLLVSPLRATELALLASLIVAWLWPGFGERPGAAVQNVGVRLASKPGWAMVSIAAGTICLRIALLGLLPVPVPHVHDEFSYLLAADTFAHGRLSNPAHPMSIYFETFHVNQQPVYVSKYPPAQGAILAIGQLLGHPWVGVVLSVSLMSAAILWMLQGWLPLTWALFGAILVVLRLGIFGYWMNSYWGGAVPALGGALVMGAVPRVFHRRRARDAVWLGLGMAILMNSRLFEGFILCIPVAVMLGMWFFQTRKRDSLHLAKRCVAPLLAVLLSCGMFMLYYNWRTTGHAFVTAYQVNLETYVSNPIFLWQKELPPLHYNNPQFADFYNTRVGFTGFREVGRMKQSLLNASATGKTLVGYFLWPELVVLMLGLPWVLLDYKFRLPVVQACLCCAGFLLVPWFWPHYAAPVTATFFLLLTQAARHVSHWKNARGPVGLALMRVVVIFSVIMMPLHPMAEAPGHSRRDDYRTDFEKQLNAMAGEHLVIVRYSASHDPGNEWVYNRANIDAAKVVWAREIPRIDIKPLLTYFDGRDVWLAEPDRDPPYFARYPAP